MFHHHVHYLVEWKMALTRDRATWLYALLARMEKPLHREECVGVRMVLRECCRRRWELELPPAAGEGYDDDDDSNDDYDRDTGTWRRHWESTWWTGGWNHRGGGGNWRW